jgi:hypothetical protein
MAASARDEFAISNHTRDHIMTKIIAILLCVAMAAPAVAVARGGHYAGGHGSSHKGGKYKNARTGDHYEHRQ